MNTRITATMPAGKPKVRLVGSRSYHSLRSHRNCHNGSQGMKESQERAPLRPLRFAQRPRSQREGTWATETFFCTRAVLAHCFAADSGARTSPTCAPKYLLNSPSPDVRVHSPRITQRLCGKVAALRRSTRGKKIASRAYTEALSTLRLSASPVTMAGRRSPSRCWPRKYRSRRLNGNAWPEQWRSSRARTRRSCRASREPYNHIIAQGLLRLETRRPHDGSEL